MSPNDEMDLIARLAGQRGQAYPFSAVEPTRHRDEYERGLSHYYEKRTLGKGIPLPDNVKPSEVSDGSHSFKELYDHRIMLFLALMRLAANRGLPCGWSRRHDDGELCFGGAWVIGWIVTPTGLEARYHMEDTRPLPKDLEQPWGRPWNGKEETMVALAELAQGRVG